jgi:hypothetical protein
MIWESSDVGTAQFEIVLRRFKFRRSSIAQFRAFARLRYRGQVSSASILIAAPDNAAISTVATLDLITKIN